jgi:DNA-binding CsgD family transcriptional regulator
MRFSDRRSRELAHQDLRPIERVIARLRESGLEIPEISRRVGKKPGTVTRILRMIDLRVGSPMSQRVGDSMLRPLERVVIKLSARGESYGEIGNRLGRSGAHVRRIESYAQLKLEG